MISVSVDNPTDFRFEILKSREAQPVVLLLRLDTQAVLLGTVVLLTD
jgi:hypothetical protein